MTRHHTTGALLMLLLTPCCSGRSPAAPPPPLAAPVVTALSDNLGSTGGGAEVRVEGTGFRHVQGNAVVTFGGIQALRAVNLGLTAILATVPAHAPGTVDVVVKNPDGQSARLANAYTYVSPDSFDPNGEWEGAADGGHVPFRFAVHNGRLTAVSCNTSGTITLTPAPAVSNGEFSFTREDGLLILGRLVSARDAIGTINLASCMTTGWFASKQ